MKPAPKPGSSSRREPASPLALRVIHGVFFGGLTAICVVAGLAEFEHLVHSQLQPFHAGPAPRPLLLLAVLASVLGMGVVLVQGVRGRSARLLWSVLILAGLGLALWDVREGPIPGRSVPSANLKILQVTRVLHEQMVGQLQKRGELPVDESSWQEALEQAAENQPTPVRTRAFAPLPFRIHKVESIDTLPEDALPGTVFLQITEDGVAYALQAVGLSPEGTPWRLQAPDGTSVVFRGAYNPDLATPPEADAPSMPALTPP